eukprot:TRINITY_DN955_c1_g1_i1.p1 TRINITY_DN955_c1_g1~~TRINITY_DN955_c1_g1_i1.p1  ORF type:complete len:348 (+),score=67.62 TRINITY_DN955_c1_g1_i1:76-1044(+)
MEGLLKLEEEEEKELQRHRQRTKLRIGGFAAAGLALGVLLVAGGDRKSMRASGTSSSIGLNDVDGCFAKGMFYGFPHMLEGTLRSVESSAEKCQARCASQDGCAHFTFWPDGGCLLTGNTSMPQLAGANYLDVIFGPRTCADVATFAKYVPDGMTPGTSYCSVAPIADGSSPGSDACARNCDSHSTCKYYSFWENGAQSRCRLTETCDTVSQQTDGVMIAIYEKATASPSPSSSSSSSSAPGINGTSCAAYPACAAAGMEGACCPNQDGVSLGCCSAAAAAPAVASVAKGTECSAFPSCAALNMTGGCCPTADGVRLGCCDA